MSEIFRIFKQDIKKIFGSKIAVLILVGMIFIPGIYAWLNIDSNWDPYDNTGNLKIAVANKDEGTTIISNEVNIGDELVENLKKNNAMNWIFVSEDEAKTGVENGEYYGAIILPSNFSSSLTTLFDGTEIKKPQFDFLVNQKKNPIAPIIVNKAVGAIETTLDQALVNEVIYRTVDKAESINLGEKGVATTNALISRLNETKISLDKIKTTLNVVTNSTSATASSFATIKDLLPTIDNLANTANTNILDLQTDINALGNVYNNIDGNLSATLQTSEKVTAHINERISSLSPSDTNFQQKLTDCNTILSNISSILDEQQKIVSALASIVHSDRLDTLNNKIDQARQKANELQRDIQGVADGTTLLSRAKENAARLAKLSSELPNYYSETVSPIVKERFSSLNTSLKTFINAFTSLNGSSSKSSLALSSTIDALNSTSEFAVNINDLLSNLRGDIDKMIQALGGATESELYLKLLNLLQNSPKDIADFLSSPITTNEIDYYPITHYGSKMSPFYTILAAWVGCTLLVAILKTDIESSEKDRRIKSYQAFFGRFMLFGSIAILQGLIIGIGDIILGVQVINHPLFLLTIMISSLVYMLIVYSLAISFGKIGEAIAVVMMVLQVAGSGGTFPIELVPDFFQKLQHFMPFYPSMNALRETIGGFYQSSYISFILILLCHTIIPLLLGLVIRKPIIKLKNKLSKEVEETDVII